MAVQSDDLGSEAVSLRQGLNGGVHGRWRCLPLGQTVSMIGGLALVAAYFMPWFGISSPQGSLVLTGEFLGRFLGGTSDLRRFVPGASGDPSEAAALRALVLLFPVCGGLAALLAVFGMRRQRSKTGFSVLLCIVGLIPLGALAGGLSRLPPRASIEVGLWLIGLAAVAVLVGAALAAVADRERVAE